MNRRNSIKAVKTYPGADVTSDRNPLVQKIQIKLKKLLFRKNKGIIRTSRLQDPVVKEYFRGKLMKRLDNRKE